MCNAIEVWNLSLADTAKTSFTDCSAKLLSFDFNYVMQRRQFQVQFFLAGGSFQKTDCAAGKWNWARDRRRALAPLQSVCPPSCKRDYPHYINKTAPTCLEFTRNMAKKKRIQKLTAALQDGKRKDKGSGDLL